MAITGHNVVIGKRAWAKLPEDVQAIFMEEAKKSQQEYIDWLDAFESKAVENIKAAGGEFPKGALIEQAVIQFLIHLN